MSRVDFSDDDSFDSFDDLLGSDELDHNDDVMANFEMDENSDVRIHDDNDNDDDSHGDDDDGSSSGSGSGGGGGGRLTADANDGEPNFQPAALKHILQHQSWMDDGRTTISDDALEMMGKLTKLFIAEALGRASKIAHANAHLMHHQDLPDRKSVV